MSQPGPVRSQSVPPPKCKAILLCDQTIVEIGTGKVSIIGVFDRFYASSFPIILKPFAAFLQLVEGVGRYDVVVEIHDLKNDTVLARAAGIGIEFPERLMRLNVTIPVPPLPIHHAGVYDLVVFANGQEIDRQKFEIAQPEDTHEPGQPAD